jgi:hypothetical protein
MGKTTCPERMAAHRTLNRLERNGLADTRLWLRLAEEQDRDLRTAESRLGAMLAKAAPLVALLDLAGRSRPRRRAAKEAIRASRARVR